MTPYQWLIVAAAFTAIVYFTNKVFIKFFVSFVWLRITFVFINPGSVDYDIYMGMLSLGIFFYLFLSSIFDIIEMRRSRGKNGMEE